MATISVVFTYPGYDKTGVHTWANMANADVGEPLQSSALADRSVQVFGTFSGGSVTIQGSNDGVNWATLTDLQGNDLVFSTAKIEMITEITRYIRPVVSGAGASLTVVLFAKGNV
jgi:hypothetical protein